MNTIIKNLKNFDFNSDFEFDHVEPIEAVYKNMVINANIEYHNVIDSYRPGDYFHEEQVQSHVEIDDVKDVECWQGGEFLQLTEQENEIIKNHIFELLKSKL